jgi:hypothetical protein
MPAIFWLVMNKGKWFSTPSKIALTILNVIILGIAIAIVCFPDILDAYEPHANDTSVDWDYTSRVLLSTRVLPRPAGHAPTTLPK